VHSEAGGKGNNIKALNIYIPFSFKINYLGFYAH